MILDHIDNLELPDEMARKYNNELYTLRNLQVGLHYLYQQVLGVERKLIGQNKNNIKLMTSGNIPGVPKELLSLVTCAFHWYAVSAWNYVCLVGWLAHNADKNQRKPKKYAHDVIPIVETYRHKVAAHLSLLDPKDDTRADIMATTLFPLSLTENGFYVGGVTVHIHKSSSSRVEKNTDQSKHDFRWSLTKTHTELTKRYWPSHENKS